MIVIHPRPHPPPPQCPGSLTTPPADQLLTGPLTMWQHSGPYVPVAFPLCTYSHSPADVITIICFEVTALTSFLATQFSFAFVFFLGLPFVSTAMCEEELYTLAIRLQTPHLGMMELLFFVRSLHGD